MKNPFRIKKTKRSYLIQERKFGFLWFEVETIETFTEVFLHAKVLREAGFTELPHIPTLRHQWKSANEFLYEGPFGDFLRNWYMERYAISNESKIKI